MSTLIVHFINIYVFFDAFQNYIFKIHYKLFGS